MTLLPIIKTTSIPVKAKQHFIMNQVCWRALSHYLSAQSEHVYPLEHMVTISETLTTKPQC